VHEGPITPKGNRPRYKLNGIPAFLITHAAFYLASWQLGWFSPGIVYDHFGSILATLCVFSLIFCLFLYFKGAYFPSTTDSGRSGNFIWDYYWGVELHPQIAGVHLKQLANCRLGMMGWSVIILSFAAKQVETTGSLSNSMLVSVLLQMAYILKFFYWEGGYFGSLDIMHDRFGFYICWGVTAWLPCVYTITTLYLVGHPNHLHPGYAAFLVVLGIAAIAANYDADAQRQRVRQTQGQTTVWGKKPDVIVAEYRTADGETHTNLLLASGWWKLSRHFHYISELTLALAWTLPAGFNHLLPYFYLIFLTILLVDRSGRDELRCREKYGKYWAEYCDRVRYRLVPFIY
jgi:7-dehydrocholesterol reductase